MGDWEFLPLCHYGFNQQAWEDVKRRFITAASGRSGGEAGPRVLVEIRNDWSATSFLQKIVPDLELLRQETEAFGCSITTSFLMRDPIPQYVSFYRYYIEKLQKAPDVSSGSRGPAAFGEDIIEWAAHVPDIQVREVLGDKCTSQIRDAPFQVQHEGGRVTRAGAKPIGSQCLVSEVDYEQFASLLRKIDVVGTTDRFDAFWLRLSDVVGFQHLEYVASNQASESSSSQWKKPNLATDIMLAINRTAIYDTEGYALASQLQAKQIEEGGADFQMRLAAYIDKKEARGSKKYRGGVPPPSKYKWVAKDKLNGGKLPPNGFPSPEEYVQPAFYTGPALCRGFGSNEVVLVPHQSKYTCDRGCTFD